MSEGGLEPRVTSLESQVKDLRARLEVTEQDAAARVLAGATDRDIGEITAGPPSQASTECANTWPVSGASSPS